MAKLECILDVGFDDALERIEEGVLNGSVSATLEDSSNSALRMPGVPSGSLNVTAGAAATG